VSLAKILEVLATRGDEGMPLLEHRGRDEACAPKALLRVVQPAGDLADDGEVVQSVGEVGMQRAESLLLHPRGFAQQRFGGDVVSRGRGLFCFFDDRASFPHSRLVVQSGGDRSTATNRHRETPNADDARLVGAHHVPKDPIGYALTVPS